ncbi:MAG: cation transporter [Pseudomonadota bacterium]
MTGSLALIADAAHMATDAGGLALALLAIHFAQKGPNAAKKLTVICVPRSSLH